MGFKRISRTKLIRPASVYNPFKLETYLNLSEQLGKGKSLFPRNQIYTNPPIIIHKSKLVLDNNIVIRKDKLNAFFSVNRDRRWHRSAKGQCQSVASIFMERKVSRSS